jgi:hypothetical protein
VHFWYWEVHGPKKMTLARGSVFGPASNAIRDVRKALARLSSPTSGIDPLRFRSGKPAKASPLRRDETADVVVVDSGIAGLSTA